MDQNNGTDQAQAEISVELKPGAPIEAAPQEKPAPTAPESAKPEGAEVPDRFGPKFAALSRKERLIREREKQLEARQKEIEEKAKQAEEKFKKFEELPKRAKQNVFEVLNDLGLSSEELLDMLANEGKPTEKMQRNEELESLKEYVKNLEAKINGSEQERLEQQKKAEQERYDKTLASFKQSIKEHVDSTPALELTRANNAEELVYEVIDQHFKETNEIMEIADAALKVEQYFEAELERLLALEKVKQKAGVKPVSKEPPKDSATLSNDLTTEVPSSGQKFLSDEESKREAAKLIKWHD
ncbi:MAG: hypothetical protein FMNOHCHN_03730 [Ignavibacteriaceae bacterium]|nr:hypothetical protein [Ignavibacteriaceae bacterium]